MDTIIKLPHNPEETGMARMIPNVLFSAEHELYLHLLSPWINAQNDKRYPLIVFVQGSGFQFPDVYYQIPQLAQYAKAGYVVATVTHRNSVEGHPFPAYLQDVKTAIRFLRANAAEYHIDPSRVGIWGTSSGGNAALLAMLTADEPQYKTSEYAEHSDAVKLTISCFPPSDINWYIKKHMDTDSWTHDMLAALKGDNDISYLQNMDVTGKITADRTYPPILLLHGDNDTVVSFAESQQLYQALQSANADVQFVQVENAGHEGDFWSEALHQIIRQFLAKHL